MTYRISPLVLSQGSLVICTCLWFATLIYVGIGLRGSPLNTAFYCHAPTHPRGELFSTTDRTKKTSPEKFDFFRWSAALRMSTATTFPEQAAAEAAIAAHFPVTATHVLAARFPLPEIRAIVDLKDGTCLLGRCGEMRSGAATWGPDTHIRDLINSIMLTCAFRWEPDDCLALDIGSNFGLHTFGMLQLGARVISIEPQTDLCVASRLSIQANGWSTRSIVVCGGIAAAGNQTADTKLNISNTNPLPLHRYQGPRFVPQYNNPPLVPMYRINQLIFNLPLRTTFRLVKIDTDSIDCAVANQILDAVDKEKIIVGAFIFESWDMTCRGTETGRLLVRLRRLGFHIYRVHITERSWNDNHVDTKRNFEPLQSMPVIFVEQFCQRFNFNVWKMILNASDEAVIDVATIQWQYQYVATKDPFILTGYVTSEQ